MADPFATGIASLSLTISFATLWLAYLRRGTIRMTRPTMIALTHDGPSGPAKVFLRTLLYCTAKRGRIVENIFVKLHDADSVRTFPIWGYGDERLARGSGIHVAFDGLTCNHHFLLAHEGRKYAFRPGNLRIEVYASPLHSIRPTLLSTIDLVLTEEHSVALERTDAAAFFNWSPEDANYKAHIDQPPKPNYLHARPNYGGMII